MRRLLWSLLCTMLVGCNSYERFVETLNERQITSCIQGDLALHGTFGAGGASGAVRVYTATGGAPMADCLRLLRHGEVPPAAILYPVPPVP